MSQLDSPISHRREVYPRVCGGTVLQVVRRRSMGQSRAVYPRVCGGTQLSLKIALVQSAQGLSPRVRGNRR